MKHSHDKEHIAACKQAIASCQASVDLCNQLLSISPSHDNFGVYCKEAINNATDCIQMCHDAVEAHREHIASCPDRDCHRACELSNKAFHETIQHAEGFIKHAQENDPLCLELCKQFIESCKKSIHSCEQCLTKKELSE